MFVTTKDNCTCLCYCPHQQSCWEYESEDPPHQPATPGENTLFVSIYKKAQNNPGRFISVQTLCFLPTWHISVMVSSNTPPASSAPSPTSLTFQARDGSRSSRGFRLTTCFAICTKMGLLERPLWECKGGDVNQRLKKNMFHQFKTARFFFFLSPFFPIFDIPIL